MSLQRQIMALSPVGYWPLNETSGSTGFDISGNAKHGTYSGSPALATRQFLDGKLYTDFDGTNDYLAINDDNAWSVTTSGFLSGFCVVQADATIGSNAFRPIIGKFAASNYEWRFSQSNETSYATEAIMFISATSAGGDKFKPAGANNSLAAARWYAFGFSWTDSTIANVYQDGVLAATSSTPGAGVHSNTGSSLVIGSVQSLAGYFNGAICHMALFSTALTADQHATLAKAAIRSGAVGG